MNKKKLLKENKMIPQTVSDAWFVFPEPIVVRNANIIDTLIERVHLAFLAIESIRKF